MPAAAAPPTTELRALFASELARAAARFPEAAARLPEVELRVSRRLTRALANARTYARPGDQQLQPRVTVSAAALLALGAAGLRETLIHEIAHLYADALAGRRQCHGPLWRQVAAELGIEPRRLAAPAAARKVAAVHARLRPVRRRRRNWITRWLARG